MMGDLISRSRLLDSLHREDTRLIGGNHYVRMSAVQEKIRIAPTVDAVEVVRCRECRLWRRVEKHSGKCPFLIGEHQYTSDDHFCSLGEKMDGGAEG